MDIVGTALSLGMRFGLRATDAHNVQDEYLRLKALLQRAYPQVEVDLLEADPESRARRAALEEDLQTSGATQDAEVLHQAQRVLDAIQVQCSTPGSTVGVGVENITATAVEIADVVAQATGPTTGVYVRRANIAGAIKISNVKAGVSSDGSLLAKESRVVPKITILFLAANPLDTVRLRLDEESRAIDQALRSSNLRDRFDIQQNWAVRVGDIQELLLRHQPNILHFRGHGGSDGELILEDETGKTQAVTPAALGRLLAVLDGQLQCVVLNACYSKVQAHVIAEHVDYVVGMTNAIGDSAAISFTTAFYRALGYGRDIKTAFELGCAQIDLEALGVGNMPQLLARG